MMTDDNDVVGVNGSGIGQKKNEEEIWIKAYMFN